MLKNLFLRYKEAALYLVFGGLTTVINILTFFLLYEILGWSNVSANVMAWILSVLFAYVTNKVFVFESKGRDPGALIKEIALFYGFRLATGVLDVAIMYLSVDVFHGEAMVFKVISNVLVILLNYVASKAVIFSKSR